MAETVFTTSKRTLECSICFRTYNMKDRIPKNLRCGHSFCESCVNNLNQNSVIKCPKDRTDSKINDLVTCFAVTDILDTLCEDCGSLEKSVKCHHCDKTLCTKCLGNHARSYHCDLISELDELDQHILNISDASNNVGFIELQHQKARATIEQIRQSTKARRDALDQLEKDLEEDVKKFEKHNTEQCVKWKKNLKEQLQEAREFYQQSREKLQTTKDPVCSMEVMFAIHKDSKTLSTGIQDSRQKEPLVIGYTFVPNTDVTKVSPGEFVLTGPPEAAALCKVPQASGQSADIYRTARFKCMTGQHGSDPDEFNMPSFVASMDNRLIITDSNNHRIKIYDQSLHLLHIHGSYGSSHDQFDSPEGVAVNTKQEILICDSGNDRVTVLTEYLRGKASKFNHLEACAGLGLCVSKIGTLFICEEERERLKVAGKDGMFLKRIGDFGSSDQLNVYPIDVKLHGPHEDAILVSDNKGLTLKVFSIYGRYIKSIPENVCGEYADNQGGPTGIAVDKYNNIIYADTTGYLVVLNQEGEFVCTIGSPGHDAGQLNDPLGVNITPQGEIVVCDRGNDRIQIFEVG